MKITALIENKSNSDLLSEHGLAVHIEYNSKNYLLDTGASPQFATNAKTMGIDLAKVDTAFLSHSHYDHSGGYEQFFSVNSGAKVYMQKEAQEECFAKILGIRKYIGIPRGVLSKYKDRIGYVSQSEEIEPGVWLIRHTTKNLAMKAKKDHFYRMVDHKLLPDDLLHEQSLVFVDKDGLVILNSCCHAGVDHIVEEVKELLKDQPIKAVIGGFHLMGVRGPSSKSMSKDKIAALGKRVVDLGVEHIYTCHCTGDPAYAILKEALGNQISYFKTGDVIEF